jgi:predicted metalloprotease with PDZ domain
MRRYALCAVLLIGGTAAAADPPGPVTVEVDLSDLGRRVIHNKVSFAAAPGPMTLNYPKWIPGTHGPIGPVGEQAGFRVKAGGKTLDWKRDDVDAHAYHVTVPEGATTVEVTFDLLLQPPGSGGWLGTTLTSASPKLAILNWNEVLVYPSGDGVMTRPCHATVKLPTGWKYGTALTTETATGDRVKFAAAGLEELIDSPVLCGEYFKEIPIGPKDGPKHRVVLACDSPAGLDVPAETKAGWDRLVVETEKLFGARHYRAYTFLLALSDQVPSFGLEHHESSDNRVPELTLVTAPLRARAAALLPHEFVHSWNGKYRRPADMIVPDYQQAQKTRLLWVYEGLTNYLGEILAVRSGLRSTEDGRDALAATADQMAYARGRAWRPLDDTAAVNWVLGSSPQGWTAYRRSLDYYPEGTLIWLEADVIIRTKTKGQKSLDDFCRLFHGGEGGKPRVKGYTLDDLAAALNEVVKHDWKGHFTRRVSVPNEAPPLDGITGGGWKLTYGDKPSAMHEAGEGIAKGLNLFPSIGLSISGGKVGDVLPDGPAYKAGLAPGVKVVAVNGREYSDAGLKAAVAATKDGGKLELLTKTGEFYKPLTIDYKGGLRYPHLERGPGPDLLGDILKPLAPPPPAPAPPAK